MSSTDVSAERKCPNCGALPSSGDLRFCGYCGTELPQPQVSTASLRGPLGDVELRFQALDGHAEVPEILTYQPRTGSATASMMGQAIFGLLFTGVAFIMTIGFAAIAGPLAIVPLMMVVVGAVITISGFNRALTYKRSPLERMRAAVVDERIKVSGGGENSRARTTYYATLQFPDGDRREYEVGEDIASDVVPGDIGIAFVKGVALVDFRRVDV